MPLNRIDAEYICNSEYPRIWERYCRVFAELRKYDIPIFSYEIKAKRVAGFAYYRGNRITINLSYVVTLEYNDVIELLAHELAHQVCYKLYPQAKQGHGAEFRYIMQQLGYSGDTYLRVGAGHRSKVKEATKRLKDEDILFSL